MTNYTGSGQLGAVGTLSWYSHKKPCLVIRFEYLDTSRPSSCPTPSSTSHTPIKNNKIRTVLIKLHKKNTFSDQISIVIYVPIFLVSIPYPSHLVTRSKEPSPTQPSSSHLHPFPLPSASKHTPFLDAKFPLSPDI